MEDLRADGKKTGKAGAWGTEDQGRVVCLPWLIPGRWRFCAFRGDCELKKRSAYFIVFYLDTQVRYCECIVILFWYVCVGITTISVMVLLIVNVSLSSLLPHTCQSTLLSPLAILELHLANLRCYILPVEGAGGTLQEKGTSLVGSSRFSSFLLLKLVGTHGASFSGTYDFLVSSGGTSLGFQCVWEDPTGVTSWKLPGESLQCSRKFNCFSFQAASSKV